MSNTGSTNRWWENYLVRYLMPSIAGMVIVMWLSGSEGNGVRSFLLLPSSAAGLDSDSVVLLFLYGNLFCYVASYPILCFHATRVLDFPFAGWTSHRRWSSYIWTAALAFVVLLLSLAIKESFRFYGAVFAVLLFSGYQAARIYRAQQLRVKLPGVYRPVSSVFGYTYLLSRVRGVVEDQSDFRHIVPPASASQEQTRESIIRWKWEFIETYRHLREHGNSSYIFVLELILCGLLYCALFADNENVPQLLSRVAVLLAIWAAPAVLVHCVGQNLEREFSMFSSTAEEVRSEQKNGS